MIPFADRPFEEIMDICQKARDTQAARAARKKRLAAKAENVSVKGKSL